MRSKIRSNQDCARKGAVFLFLLLVLVLGIPAQAFADDATTFSVTVPSSLPIVVDADGTVIGATNISIRNNKTGPIAVSSIRIEGLNGWTLKEFGTDYTKMPTDLKEFSLKIGDKEVPDDGNADLSGIPFIQGGEEVPISYDANVAVQTDSLSEQVIGQMLLTVGWREGQLYSLTITKAPDKQSYTVGDAFDPTGMEVVATYYGGEQKVLTDYEILNGSSLTAGQTGVTIRATGESGQSKSAVCPVTVSRKLTAIKIKSLPAKTTYNAGESFNEEGMVVEAVYADGGTSIVSSYTVSPTVLTKDCGSVTVSYTEGGITKSVSFSITIAKSTKIPEAEITLSTYEYTYDGTEKCPSATVVLDGVTLKKGTDYTLSYENNLSAGTAKAVITGCGNFTGQKSVDFTIVQPKEKLTVSWSNLSFTCDNTKKTPTATLSGLQNGDAATVTVEGGAYEPGTHTATAVVTFTSGDASAYEIANGSCDFTIQAGETPKLVRRSLRTAILNAGFKKINSSPVFAGTEFVTCHTPGEDVVFTAKLDLNGTGAIKGYVYSLGGNNYRLVISGNGSSKICCNEDCYLMMSGLANNTEAGTGYLKGVEILDTSAVTNVRYMFINLGPGDFTLPALSFDVLTCYDFMFYNVKANSLYLEGLTAPCVTSAEYMFQKCNISGELDLHNIDTSHILSLCYMFTEGTFGTLDLNCMNVSACESFEGMFKDASVGSLKINSWDITGAYSLEYMFQNFTGGGNPINISGWNAKAIKRCTNLFYAIRNVPAVYCPLDWTSCSNFNYMFGGSGNSISTVYAAGDFLLGNISTQEQNLCTGNSNLSATSVTALKLKENGGFLTYSEAVSDY